MLLMIYDEEIIGRFYEKELKRTNQQKCRIGKVIKKKGDKLHVKWKGYDYGYGYGSFNSWIDKKSLNYVSVNILYKNESIFSKTV